MILDVVVAQEVGDGSFGLFVHCFDAGPARVAVKSMTFQGVCEGLILRTVPDWFESEDRDDEGVML